MRTCIQIQLHANNNGAPPTAVQRWARNIAAGGMAGVSSMVFVYSLEFSFTRLAADVASAHGNHQRQFTGLLDVYRKTLKSVRIHGDILESS